MLVDPVDSRYVIDKKFQLGLQKNNKWYNYVYVAFLCVPSLMQPYTVLRYWKKQDNKPAGGFLYDQWKLNSGIIWS